MLLRKNPAVARLTRYSGRQHSGRTSLSSSTSPSPASAQNSGNSSENAWRQKKKDDFSSNLNKGVRGIPMVPRDSHQALPGSNVNHEKEKEKSGNRKSGRRTKPLMMVDAAAVPISRGVRAIFLYPLSLCSGWWGRDSSHLFANWITQALERLDESVCGRLTVSRRLAFSMFYVTGLVACFLLWSTYPRTPCRESAEAAVRFLFQKELKEECMKSTFPPSFMPRGLRRLGNDKSAGRIQERHFFQQWQVVLRSRPWLHDTPFLYLRNVTRIQEAHAMYLEDVQQCELHLAPLGGGGGTWDSSISWERLPLFLFAIHCFIRLLESAVTQVYSGNARDRVTLFALAAGCTFYVMASISFDLSSLCSLREEEARQQFQLVGLLPFSSSSFSSSASLSSPNVKASFMSLDSQTFSDARQSIVKEGNNFGTIPRSGGGDNDCSIFPYARRFTEFMLEAKGKIDITNGRVEANIRWSGVVEVLARVVRLGPWFVPRLLLLFLTFMHILVQGVQVYHHDLLASVRRGQGWKAKQKEEEELKAIVQKVWKREENKNLGDVVAQHHDKNDTTRLYALANSLLNESLNSVDAEPPSASFSPLMASSPDIRFPFSPHSPSSLAPSVASSNSGTASSVMKRRKKVGFGSPHSSFMKLSYSCYPGDGDLMDFSDRRAGKEKTEKEAEQQAIKIRKQLYEAIHDEAVWHYHYPFRSLFQVVLEPHYLCEILLYLIQLTGIIVVFLYSVFPPAAYKKHSQLVPWIAVASKGESLHPKEEEVKGVAWPTRALLAVLLMQASCSLGASCFTIINLAVTAEEHRSFWEDLNAKRLIVKEFVLEHILRPEDTEVEEVIEEEEEMEERRAYPPFQYAIAVEGEEKLKEDAARAQRREAMSLEKKVKRRRQYRKLFSATDSEVVPPCNLLPMIW